MSVKMENRHFIDPRKDISISEIIVSNPIKTRPLNPVEIKKLARTVKEDPVIYNFHPDLQEKEDFLYRQCVDIKVDYTPIPGLVTPLMEHQYYGVSWMLNREQSEIRGGILADEMGLGKTLQTIALMMKGREGDLNLVVVPSVAMAQWIAEIEKHAPSVFNILPYHGRTKSKELKIQQDKFNVILTTYGTVESSCRRKEETLYTLQFKRIVLDEAHLIKEVRI